MMKWELGTLFYINNELRNTFEEIEDYQKALNDLYENYMHHISIKLDFEEWTFNENGDIIKHSEEEYHLFYDKIWNKIYHIILYNTFKETFPEYKITKV